MNKNIRRSIVIAAGVTGAWALGSAVASADELATPAVTAPDATPAGTSLTGTLTDTVDGVLTDVHDTVSGVTGTATSTVSDPVTAVGQKARSAEGAVSDQHRRYVEGNTMAGAKVRGGEAITGARAARAAQAQDRATHITAQAAHTAHTADQVTRTAEGHLSVHVSVHVSTPSPRDAQSEIDYLFGPLSTFAPEVEQALAAAQTKLQATQAAARMRAEGVQGAVRTTAQQTVAGAKSRTVGAVSAAQGGAAVAQGAAARAAGAGEASVAEIGRAHV